MKKGTKYLITGGITAVLASGAVSQKGHATIWPGCVFDSLLQWGAIRELDRESDEQNNARATEEARNDNQDYLLATQQAGDNNQDQELRNLQGTEVVHRATEASFEATQQAQINDLEDRVGTPVSPRPTDTPYPIDTPRPSDTPIPTQRPSDTPYPTAKPTDTPRPTPRPTDTPYPTVVAATPTPDTLSRLIGYARDLPRSVDLPPEEGVQDRPEGLYIRVFKVWEENGGFRHEELADLAEANPDSLENHRIGAPTRPYWTVAIAGEDFVNEIEGYSQSSDWINPSSLRRSLILEPGSRQQTGINSIQFNGRNADSNDIVYAEVIRTQTEQ